MLSYYFDEHVDGRIANGLRRRSIDVLTAQEAGRAGRKIADPDQLAYASTLGRVIVAQDHHFEMLAYVQLPHAGVIWLQQEDSIGNYTEFLEYIAKTTEPEEIANRLLYYDW